jgi:DNA-binding response OmpR family regulator
MSDTQPYILIVEDDRFLARAYQSKLANAGFRLATAYDGEEAVSMLSQERPDLMILDIIMPKKNGFEVLQEMQTHPEWKTIPVILLTNLGQEEDRKKGRELGAVDYIIKADFSLQEIVTLIKKHLHQT